MHPFLIFDVDMIAKIAGRLLEKEPTALIIDCNGVGYYLNVSLTTSEKIGKVNDKISLMTEMIVREDSIQLFGFFDKNEKNMFKLLISVSGIGAKMAMNILSAIEAKELINILLTSNSISLQKLPGIGKKTAERMILELSDKVGGVINQSVDTPKDSDSVTVEDAIQAMITLGYNKKVAETSVKKAIDELDKPYKTEEIIKKALKHTLK